MLARPADDAIRVQGAGHPGDLPATGEQHHGRDAADAELRTERLLLLGVHFQQAHLRLELTRGLFNNGGNACGPRPASSHDSGATVLGRITIGKGSVIGGGVWVTSDLPPGSFVTQARTQVEAFTDGGGI